MARGLCARPPGDAGALEPCRSSGRRRSRIAVSAMAAVFLVRQGAAVIRLRLMAIMGEWVARDTRTSSMSTCRA